MHHIGRFVWHELMTVDPIKSMAFHAALFPEWTILAVRIDSPRRRYTFHRIVAAGIKSGGFVPLDRSLGIPSHWMTYVEVDDCDAAAGRAVAAGGRLLSPPHNAPGIGRFAGVIDPRGAKIKHCKLLEPDPLPDDAAAGQFCWDELLTDDIDASCAFYTQVYGWTVTDFELATGGKYVLWHAAGRMVGGGMNLPAEAAGTPPSWLPYIAAPDVDARFAKALTLGAHPYVPPRDIPGVGRFAVLAEPTGAPFALFGGQGMRPVTGPLSR